MISNILFEDLNINPKIIDSLKRHKISNFIQILTTPTSELTRLTKLSLNEILILRTSIINALSLPQPLSALTLFKEEKLYLGTGCNEINTFLNGGLVSSWLTEISGESSSGKTQFCLQLCITVQLLQSTYGALYISTEDAFPSKRLNEMCERLINRCPHLRNQSFMNQIYIEHSATLEDLEELLNIQVPYLLENKNVKLIIVDSVAAIARSESYKKKLIINSICSKLSKFGALYNIYVVLINQVTDKFDELNNVLIKDDSNSKCPSLGPSWAHWMHMRLQLFRTEQYISVSLKSLDFMCNNQELLKSFTCKNENLLYGQNVIGNTSKNSDDSSVNNVLIGSNKIYNTNVRKLLVLSAPHLPQSHIRFFIDADGIKYFGN